MDSGSAIVDPAALRTWIQRARKGDIGSYQCIYDSFARKVLNFIYRMVHSQEEAEDLTQETFVVVYQKLGTLKDIDRFEPWLFRIARNFVYQKYRKRAPSAVSIDAPNEDGRLRYGAGGREEEPGRGFSGGGTRRRYIGR